MGDKKSMAASVRFVPFDENNEILEETEIIHASNLLENMIEECPPFWKNSNLVKCASG
jgi:hypothetical protein